MLLPDCIGQNSQKGGCSIRREELKQANSYTPEEYRWRPEEVSLISALMGAVEEHDDRNEPTVERDRPAYMQPERQPELATRHQSTQIDIRDLVSTLTEEIKAHRGEIKQLHTLIHERQPQLIAQSPDYPRRPWWQRLWGRDKVNPQIS